MSAGTIWTFQTQLQSSNSTWTPPCSLGRLLLFKTIQTLGLCMKRCLCSQRRMLILLNPPPTTSWLVMWRFKCALWFLFTKTSVHTYFHLISKAYVCVCSHVRRWSKSLVDISKGLVTDCLRFSNTQVYFNWSQNEHRQNHIVTFTIRSITVYSSHGRTTAYWHIQGHVQSMYIALQNVWEGKIKDEDTNNNLSLNMCRPLWFSWYNANTESHFFSSHYLSELGEPWWSALGEGSHFA